MTSISNGNSTVNQRIKGEFVAKHVYCNVTGMVEYILRQDDYKNAPFTLEDIENYWHYPEYYGKYVNFDGGTQEDLDSEIERLEELMANMMETDQEQFMNNVQYEIDALNGLEQEPAEIYEWWLVSSFLCEKLEDLGLPVISGENIWGRCTTGQAILLDYAITQICSDMGILEGQENSWA